MHTLSSEAYLLLNINFLLYVSKYPQMVTLTLKFNSFSTHIKTMPCMKTKNKTGPNTEPCGTPDLTVTWEDFSFSKRTVCDLFDRNALI